MSDKTSGKERLCVSQDDKLQDALACLQQNSHGLCVVVDAEHRILGTITDGDCRRALLRGLTVESPASEAMNRNFVTVDQSFSLEQIRLLMRTNDIRQIPVVDGERRLVTVVSERSLQAAGTKRPNAALILAGGKGKRLGALTRHRPKPMLPVAGKPMLEHIIAQLVDVHITTIYVSINYLGGVIREHFGDGSRWGCSIEYVTEDIELGTAGPIKLIEDRIQSPLIVTNGDVITTVNFGAFLDYHTASRLALTMGVRGYTVQVPYGVVSMDDAGLVVDLVEKPSQNFPINAGIYVLEPRLFKYIPGGTAYPMTELVRSAIRDGERIGAFIIHEIWDDVGVPTEFVTAQTLLEED